RHKNNLETLYGHLSKINVKVGQTVNTGQIVGQVGSTGYSTGNHLHYEVRKNGKPVNPKSFLSIN
ncbi:MAG: M23 family metallopeptidase, partial [Daejeonella sp.]|nr:M23 family metallopeptidase [Daejeonella sp.]